VFFRKGELAVKSISPDVAATLPEDARASLLFSVLVKRNGPATESVWNTVNSAVAVSCRDADLLTESSLVLLLASVFQDNVGKIIVQSLPSMDFVRTFVKKRKEEVCVVFESLLSTLGISL
jgi:hypothetical protein